MIQTLFGAAFIIFLFLILREFWCWYFKINQIRDLLTDIEKNTRKGTILNSANKSEKTERPIPKKRGLLYPDFSEDK